MLNCPATMNAVIERGVVCARLGELAGFPRGIQPNKSSGIKASEHSVKIESNLGQIVGITIAWS